MNPAAQEAFQRQTQRSCRHRWPKGGCRDCSYATWVTQHGGEPPLYDHAAEATVVAACLVDEDALQAIQRTGIQPADFHDPNCAYAYGAILDVWERDNTAVYIVGRAVLGAVNQVTVAHRLASIPDDSGRQSQLEAVGGSTWLSWLVDELVTSIGAEWSAELVKDCAARRRTVVAAEMLAEAARHGDGNVAAKGAALFGALAKPQASAPVMTLDGCGVCVTGEIVCYGSNEQGYCAEHVPAELRGSVWVA